MWVSQAIECELEGLEGFDKMRVREAFAKIKLKSQQVLVTVKNITGSNGYPVVSIITAEDHQSLEDMLRNILDPPQITENDEITSEMTVQLTKLQLTCSPAVMSFKTCFSVENKAVYKFANG